MVATIGSLTSDILTDIINSISHEIVAEQILKEKHLRIQFGPALPVKGVNKKLVNAGNNTKQKTKIIEDRFALNGSEVAGGVTSDGKDVFGNDKVNDSTVYFACSNCKRNIAGSRFANHINRCLGGRNNKKG